MKDYVRKKICQTVDYFNWIFPGLGNRSFALRSFALFKKSAQERFALLLFSKRATRSETLFRSLLKERQRANCSLEK